MGLVVEFGVPMVRPKRVRRETVCEITIFPGVRYERHETGDGRRPPDEKRGTAMALREQEDA